MVLLDSEARQAAAMGDSIKGPQRRWVILSKALKGSQLGDSIKGPQRIPTEVLGAPKSSVFEDSSMVLLDSEARKAASEALYCVLLLSSARWQI